MIYNPDTRGATSDDDGRTEYPLGLLLDYIPLRPAPPRRSAESNIVPTADAYGVMPPIAKLTPAQAM